MGTFPSFSILAIYHSDFDLILLKHGNFYGKIYQKKARSLLIIV